MRATDESQGARRMARAAGEGIDLSLFFMGRLIFPFYIARERQASHGIGKACGVWSRKTILHQKSFLILYFSFASFHLHIYILFSLLYLHLESFLILYFLLHSSTSCYYKRVVARGGRMKERSDGLSHETVVLLSFFLVVED
jgi:hypothetical protein